MNNQKGFSVVVLVLAVAILTGVGFVGYRVYNSSNKDAGVEGISSVKKSESSTIKNKDDLAKAKSNLESQQSQDNETTSDLNSIDKIQ
jgi:hypothetical protein